MIGLVLRATAPGRVRVVGVKPNSPAARAGICADDAVVAVGGVSIRDLATVSSVIHNHCAQYPVTRACRPLAFTLRRNGKLIHAAVIWW
jgi:predicted metalloprotease with PDZ domain